MEGYWGMGKTVSSAASARRLEGGTPGGGQRAAAPGTDAHGPNPFGRLADRIEDNLSLLLVKAEEILRDNERYVLAMAHALETHKTLSGEDVTAVFEGGRGPLVNGAPYGDDAFIGRLRDYHLAAKRAHQQHNQPELQIPEATPAYAIADGFGSNSLLDGSYGSNGNGAGSGTDDVIGFGGFGAGNGSHGTGSNGGPLSAPTYDPPSFDPPPGGSPDDPDDEH
jgi:hypothetical protein